MVNFCTRSAAAFAVIAAGLLAVPVARAQADVPVAGTAAGHWQGTASAGGASYSVVVDIRPDGSANVLYGAPLNCSASWKLVTHSGSFFSYEEHMTKQTKSCRDGGAVTLVQDFAGKSISFRLSAANGMSATALLHRGTSP